MPRKHLSRPFIILITLLVVGAASTMAQSFAQVGYAHPDGTVELDEARFAPWIATSPETGEPLGETVLGISNGLVKAVRIAEDQCTSEELQLYVGYPLEESFIPLQAGVLDGEYPIGANLVPPGNPGPVYVAQEMQAAFLFDCKDDGCRQSRNGACLRTGQSRPLCLCVWIEGFEHNEQVAGCKRTLAIRSWWLLSHSVLSSFIQDL